MTTTGCRAFDATLDKTNQVLKEIEEAYGWPQDRRQQSYDSLSAVLHALRDRLSMAEAADLGAQLPMLIRGLYYEGWDPSRVPIKLSRDEFLERIRRDFTFSIEGSIEQLVRTVLHALRSYITDGEWADIVSTLPKDLVPLLAS